MLSPADIPVVIKETILPATTVVFLVSTKSTVTVEQEAGLWRSALNGGCAAYRSTTVLGFTGGFG